MNRSRLSEEKEKADERLPSEKRNDRDTDPEARLSVYYTQAWIAV
jgi:hypothetical protein